MVKRRYLMLSSVVRMMRWMPISILVMEFFCIPKAWANAC